MKAFIVQQNVAGMLLVLAALCPSISCTPCDLAAIAQKLHLPLASSPLNDYGFTNRTIDSFYQNCHPLLVKALGLSPGDDNHKFGLDVLEIGCGNGHLLLGLQQKLGDASHLHCVNKHGYRSQVNEPADFVRLATAKSVPLLCPLMPDAPLLPEVILMKQGIGKEDLPEFKNVDTFDFVYSQYALDHGMVASILYI